jgi:hypothetical protein
VTAHPREVSDYRNAVLSALDLAHLTIEVHQCGLSHESRERDVPRHGHSHSHGHERAR